MLLLLCIRVKVFLWKHERMILLWKGYLKRAAFWRPGPECLFVLKWLLEFAQRVYQEGPSRGDGKQLEVGGETWRGWDEACAVAKTEPWLFLVLWFRATVEPSLFLGGGSMVEPREKHPFFFLFFFCARLCNRKSLAGYLPDLGAKEVQEDSPLHLSSH